ncbi:hypothetical protein DMX11_10175 [Pseudomonas sp. LB-090624]|nr:hypothetical protein DMX11_10175 [Pseudomonas sp. LB-090624]
MNAAAAGLISHGCTVSARYLQDRRLRMQFNRELAYYAQRVVDDVVQRRISPEEGLGRIEVEAKSMGSEIQRVIQQAIGLAAGASQAATGLASCMASLGTTCAFHGVPLMAHGGNNFYENGRGLYEGRTDVVGPVRKLYQEAAKSVGYGELEGNMAYYSADLVFSGRALSRRVPKKGAWRLYRYLDSDMERKYRQLGRTGLVFEFGSSASTLIQLNNEFKK